MTPRPRLTLHQREVLGRIRKEHKRLGAPVPAWSVGSEGACQHLTEKGYITADQSHSGPRGGRRVFYTPNEGTAMAYTGTPQQEQVTFDLIWAVVKTRGEGFDWLDDRDRAAITAAIDGGGDGAVRFSRIVDVIDAKITTRDVTRFLRGRADA